MKGGVYRMLTEESGGFPVGGILEKAAAGNQGKIFLERTVYQAVRCFIGTFSPTVSVMAVPQAFQAMAISVLACRRSSRRQGCTGKPVLCRPLKEIRHHVAEVRAVITDRCILPFEEESLPPYQFHVSVRFLVQYGLRSNYGFP